jgi:hypothetical protein
MVRAVWMKTNMSQSNDTPKPTALEDHGTLADSELDAVSGGKLSEAICKGTHIPNVVIELC